MEETVNRYHPVPQPEELSTREKDDAMGAYLMMFAAWAVGLPLPSLNLVAAVIYYYINRKTSRFVRFHALQSLYSQILTTVFNIGLVAWFIDIFLAAGSRLEFSRAFWAYCILVAAINTIYIVFSIYAAYRAAKGRFYYFIFFGKLAYHRVFLIGADSEPKPINKPPV